MRVIRGLGAALAWILATVLLILAVVLSITIVLLPLGVLLGFAAVRLYKLGLMWALPRSADVKRGIRKEARRWGRQPMIRKMRKSSVVRGLGRRRKRRGLRRAFGS